MNNISGFGTKINIVALQSFPAGFTIESFADDQDPLNIEQTEPVGYELQFDGTIVAYDKGAVIRVDVAVIPNTEDDINLKLLLSTRKGGFKWLPVQDITTMVISYPDGGKVAFSNGTILSGPLGDSIQQSGRKRTNVYTFVFASFGGAQTSRQLIQGIGQALVGLL